ncbi:hypothetical protein J6590_055544 [Homalodisca vitripennis]|nr:hypothetical protein J6590_055544 [Homalodisca vitripennis]
MAVGRWKIRVGESVLCRLVGSIHVSSVGSDMLMDVRLSSVRNLLPVAQEGMLGPADCRSCTSRRPSQLMLSSPVDVGQWHLYTKSSSRCTRGHGWACRLQIVHISQTVTINALQSSRCGLLPVAQEGMVGPADCRSCTSRRPSQLMLSSPVDVGQWHLYTKAQDPVLSTRNTRLLGFMVYSVTNAVSH